MLLDLACPCSLRPQKIALADREGDIHRILADDGRQHAAVRTNHIALCEAGLADLAGDRRNNIGVAEIDLRGFEAGLVLQ